MSLFLPYEILLLDLLKQMMYRYGDLLPKSKPDFSQYQVGLKQYQICMKNVTQYQKLESCRYFLVILLDVSKNLYLRLNLSRYSLYQFCYKQEYRDDDKHCEKLYSDPNMFFEIWKTDFMKKMDDDLVKRLERRKSKKRQTRRKLPDAPKIVTRVVIY